MKPTYYVGIHTYYKQTFYFFDWHFSKGVAGLDRNVWRIRLLPSLHPTGQCEVT